MDHRSSKRECKREEKSKKRADILSTSPIASVRLPPSPSLLPQSVILIRSATGAEDKLPVCMTFVFLYHIRLEWNMCIDPPTHIHFKNSVSLFVLPNKMTLYFGLITYYAILVFCLLASTQVYLFLCSIRCSLHGISSNLGFQVPEVKNQCSSTAPGVTGYISINQSTYSVYPAISMLRQGLRRVRCRQPYPYPVGVERLLPVRPSTHDA
ncbi:hypothetical protein R6Q59_023636 [Mikania micrantha]